MEFGFKETGIVGEPQYQKEFLRKTMYIFVLLVYIQMTILFLFDVHQTLAQNVGTGIIKSGV